MTAKQRKLSGNDRLAQASFRNTTPTASAILLIIFLGAAGLLGTLKFLTYNVKMSGYRLEHWAIRDSSLTINGRVMLVDTLKVVVHPNIALQKPLEHDIKADLDWNYRDLYMTYNPVFLVWMALISVMIACSLALSPVLIKLIRDIYQLFGLRRIYLIKAVLGALLIGVFINQTNKVPFVLVLFKILYKAKILISHPYWLTSLIMICMVAGLIAIAGQLMVNYAVTKLPENIFELDAAQQKKEVARFMLLRSSLKFFLMTDAALIVFSILTTDALKRAVFQEIKILNVPAHELFPQEFVYLYGVVFTLYLALLYLPVYYRLKYKGESMVQSLNTASEPDAKLAESFLIRESPLESFKVALSILAPVVSSLLPELIKIS